MYKVAIQSSAKILGFLETSSKYALEASSSFIPVSSLACGAICVLYGFLISPSTNSVDHVIFATPQDVTSGATTAAVLATAAIGNNFLNFINKISFCK
ncbi:MAG: hypothetical protein MJ201_02970 [Mycoplasmoidaceae bacterium]|nr:hypothetical protein [Mycoplasmoidaceae bacterium]